MATARLQRKSWPCAISITPLEIAIAVLPCCPSLAPENFGRPKFLRTRPLDKALAPCHIKQV